MTQSVSVDELLFLDSKQEALPLYQNNGHCPYICLSGRGKREVQLN